MLFYIFGSVKAPLQQIGLTEQCLQWNVVLFSLLSGVWISPIEWVINCFAFNLRT